MSISSPPLIFDNNDYKDRKSISLFKRFPFMNGVYNKKMEFTARINNVKDGRVFYSMVDTPHSTYNGEISVSPIKGIILRKYKPINNSQKQEQLIGTEQLLSQATAMTRQTTVKKIIGSFSSETPINVEVEVQLDSGYMRALLDTIIRADIITPFICICSCGGSSAPPPPPTYYTSIFEYLDVIVEYNNIIGSGNKVFYNLKTNYEDFQEGSGVYRYTKEFEYLNEQDFKRVVFGLNSNICADFSHYDEEWRPDAPEGEFGSHPCQRIHILGNLEKATIEEIWDESKGELLEEPDNLTDVTEQSLTNSQVYLEIDISNIVNQKSQVYSRKLFEMQTDDEIDFLNYNIYVRKDEKKIYIIEEFLIGVGNEEWFNNDRIRFKSKSSIGCLFIA